MAAMTVIYLVQHNYRTDDYSGREYIESVPDTDQWFATEDAAAAFLLPKGLATYDEQVASMRTDREKAYAAAVSKYKRDMRKIETAKKAGVSPALLNTPVEPRPPSTPVPQEWYDIVEIPEHTKEEGN